MLELIDRYVFPDGEPAPAPAGSSPRSRTPASKSHEENLRRHHVPLIASDWCAIWWHTWDQVCR